MDDGRHWRETERSLIERLRAGDTDAFARLFEKYRRGLLAYVRGVVRDEGLAEDVVQDCFVALARSAARINPARGVSGWLYRTARNRAIDVLRHRGFEALPGEEFFAGGAAEAAAGTSGPDAELMAGETARRLRGALAALPEREREVLTLRFDGGLTFNATARVLRRPLGTVLWQARRAVERLREMLGEESGGRRPA
ncbi:MAG: sigma-70 family RNA polymerase sigma factor [Lentisphaerae bacterium]|nr:sigma-70 family RNA polymerase sigma factor [Lentisphaerota bacterium]